MATSTVPPTISWPHPSDSAEVTRYFVYHYLQWRLPASDDANEAWRRALRYSGTAWTLYDSDEAAFKKWFGEDIGAQFHHDIHHLSPYGWFGHIWCVFEYLAVISTIIELPVTAWYAYTGETETAVKNTLFPAILAFICFTAERLCVLYPPPRDSIIPERLVYRRPGGYFTILFHPAFRSKLTHLNRRLTPLVSVTTGQPHPSFPQTVLAYHLLSSTDLDSIAAHYHQTIPAVRESHEYPKRIPPWVNTRGRPVLDIPVETKRRRIGRFIGLKGCDSPNGDGILAAIEREWEEALAQAKRKDDEEEILRKVGG